MELSINKKLISEINRAAIPLVFSQITAIIMGVIDQALVGHISIEAYGGVGLVVAVINSLVGVLGALSIVFNIVGSKSRGDQKKFNDDFSVFIIICVTIGCLLFGVFYFSSDIILKVGFGLRGESLIEASNYLKIFSLSIPINLTIFILSSTLKIFRKTKHIFMISIVTNIINLVLDYSLIFGKFGMPPLGARGAAIGTITALLVNLILYFYIVRNQVSLKLKINDVNTKIKEYLNMSLPFLGQEVMEDILFVVILNAVIARMGDIELAGYNLVFQIISIVLMPMFSYISISTSLSSEAYAKKDINYIKEVTKAILEILGIWFLLMYIVIFLGKDSIPQIITNDSSLIEFTSKLLPLAIFIQIFNYGFNVYKSVLQVVGESKWALVTTTITNIVALAIILIVAKQLWQIYLCIAVSYIFMFVLYKYRVNKVIRNI